MKKLCVLGMLCIFVLLLAAGCGKEEDKSAGSEKQAAQPTFLAIGTAADGGNYFLSGKYIADLDRQIIRYRSRGDALQTLQLDILDDKVLKAKARHAGHEQGEIHK